MRAQEPEDTQTGLQACAWKWLERLSNAFSKNIRSSFLHRKIITSLFSYILVHFLHVIK